MDFKIANAAQAYAKTLADASEGGATGAVSGEGTSFADMVSKAAGASIDAGHASEKASIQSLGKGADLTNVVAAVNNAEMTLDTVVAVRDRIIGAYQDIIKMPI